MSCSLLEFCWLQELKTVRDFLYQSKKTEPAEDKNQTDNELSWDTSDWESAWDGGDNKEGESTDNNKTGQSTSKDPWLQDCVVSLSPCSDLLVVAREHRAAFLSAKWRTDDSGREEMTLAVSWSGTLSSEEGECVSSAICIPLASQKRSSTGRPDWTCVVVGFTSGYVRFYTESGVLLLAQLLHEDPVLRLKCRHMRSLHEELSILYPGAMVTIDGFSLFQSLRACRNQVARGTALQHMFVCVCHRMSIMTLCVFDQMKNASILGGFSASVKGSPPAMKPVCDCGSWHTWAFTMLEAPSLFCQCGSAVASKLTSALFSAASVLWFVLKKRLSRKQKPKVEPATPLGIRFGLPDSRRHGESICLSPCNTLAGVTDDFGRVTLLDLARGIAISSMPPGGESWRCGRMQQGPRVGAFTVLYAGYGLMGVNSVTSQGWQLHTQQVCLMGSVHRRLRTVNVPFHLALSDKKSEQAKDMHLVKRLTTLLKSRDVEPDIFESEARSILLDIKHPAIKKQVLESLLSNKNAPVSCLTSITCALHDTLKQKDPEEVDIALLQLCSSQLKLLQLYTDIHQLHSAADVEASTENDSLEGIEDELSRIGPTLQHYAQHGSRPSVSFTFLSQMECTDDGELKVIRGSEAEWNQLGNFLFWGCLCGKSPRHKVCDTLQQAGISPQQLLSLLLSVWLQREKEVLQKPVESVRNLHTLLVALSNMKGAVEDITSRADSKLQSEWEAVSLELEQWVVCVRQLEDVLVLQTLLLVPPLQGAAGGATVQCSIKTLLEGGTGGIADSVSKWVFRQSMAPERLKEILQKRENTDGDEKQHKEEEEGNEEKDQKDPDRTAELLVAVCQRFPHSLSPDLLFAHCCWEYVVQWNKDPEEGRYLCWAVEHLKLISSPHIQLGISTMMWSTFIVKRFSAAAFLMEKVNHLHILCVQDVGIGDKAMTSFLGCCVQLLQVLMEADSAVEEVSAPELSVEEAWCGAEGPASIAELALDQRGVHFPLVQHHCLLASLLHAAMTFSLRVKPLSLFDSKGKNAFFRDLTTIQLMPNDFSSSASGSPTLPSTGPRGRTGGPPCVWSWAPCLQVNPDILRRHLVCELYNQGLDLRAEEVMLEVEDKDVLGSQLLVLTGQRLSYSLLHSQSQTQACHGAAGPPTHSDWLSARDPSELRCPLMLPEKHAQYSLALHLLEAIEALTTED
uniref:RAB3 GTPase activating protein subunit 2 (non-catalytic) n=1 Tax=Amphiprion percula TaxID=161767 RepID=A0A3P8RW40_AMPPE